MKTDKVKKFKVRYTWTEYHQSIHYVEAHSLPEAKTLANEKCDYGECYDNSKFITSDNLEWDIEADDN